jgi:Domain of unknown function (DUF4157)
MHSAQERSAAGTETSQRRASGSRPQPAVVRPAFGSPPALHLDGLLALQRTMGNRAVSRLLAATPTADGSPRGPGTTTVQRSLVHEVLRSGGRPLPGSLREEMEGRLGADFSDVRLHSGDAAQRSAAEIGARAYTSGRHIVIGAGADDKHTLAHELTHVIQQRQGPVAGSDNGSGLRVSDPSDRFEQEAEASAVRAMAVPQVQRFGCGQEESEVES